VTTVATGEYAHAAAELVQELVRVIKVRRLYDRDHPQRLEAEENAVERISHLLDAHGTVELKVEEERLLAGDEEVYRRESGGDSLASVLHREGIRQIAFYSGLTLQEFIGFVNNVVHASRPGTEEAEDGLVGRLWEEHFYHLRYTYVESLQDDEWVPPAAVRLEEAEEEEEEEAAEPIRLAADDVATAIARPEMDNLLYFLDDEDMATLQAELESEKTQTLIHETLTCLRELLMIPVRTNLGPVLKALADMQAGLLEEGSYADVQKLHQLFVPYLEGEADEAGHDAFRAMRRGALSEETLGRLLAQLEAGVVDERVAAGYYRAFGHEDPVAVLSRAGDLKRLLQRRVVASAFADLTRERPEALVEALGSPDPRTASAAAFLAGHLADPRLLEGLGGALGARDASVRREAIQALKQFGGGRALEHVQLAVDDPDPGVRLYALRHLVIHRYAPAFPAVAAMIEDERWRERSATEQRLLFEAYGALGGEAAVDPLVQRVRPRTRLFRKPDPEEVACALVGLGATGTARARQVVEDATGSRLPLVARTATQVLETWGRTGALTE
jgi:HEAT repeat protein